MDFNDPKLLKIIKYAGVGFNLTIIIFILQFFNFGEYTPWIYIGIIVLTIVELIFLTNLSKFKIKPKIQKNQEFFHKVRNIFEIPIQLFDHLIPQDHPQKPQMLANFNSIKKVIKQTQVDENTIDLEAIDDQGKNSLFRLKFQQKDQAEPTISSFEKYK